MKRRMWWLIGIIVVALAVGVAYMVFANRFSETIIPTSPPPKTQTSQNGIPDFDHIIVVVFENKGYNTIIGGDQAPYFASLAKKYALATSYYANFHPSLPNYLALTGGTNAGITNDCNPPGGTCVADTKNIADEIEASGRTWKVYEDGMPAPCTTVNSGRYATKHDPFVYYPDILQNESRCTQHVVPYGQLATDLRDDTLANYVFITPDLCHDMHDCSVKTGNDWLAAEAPKLLESDAFKKSKSLLVVTFDEAESGDRSNRIPTILVGSEVKPGFSSSATYDHYSLLHTIEMAWQLKPLTKNDAEAPIMNEFFASTK